MAVRGQRPILTTSAAASMVKAEICVVHQFQLPRRALCGQLNISPRQSIQIDIPAAKHDADLLQAFQGLELI